ncbi:MAG: histidine phosphatase family protein [Pseudomonadota bacterium]
MSGESHTTVDLLRHGEPEGGRRYRGQSDDPLSATGWQQMQAAVAGATPWQRVISSPLSRCRVFAETLAAERGLPLEVEADFREIGFGEWEGQSPEALDAASPGLREAFHRDPIGNRPPGAEPLADFRGRVVAAWHRRIAEAPGSHWLLVGHSGLIRALTGEVMGVPDAALFRLAVPYASLTRVTVHELDGVIWPQLVFHNAPLAAHAP